MVETASFLLFYGRPIELESTQPFYGFSIQKTIVILSISEGMSVARINIEDSLFREDGFLNLIEKTGSRYMALGMVVSAFMLAQKHWLKYGVIPKDLWPVELEPVVRVGLAVVRPDGIYVNGSKEQFLWLERQSAAGKSRSENKLKNLKQNRTSTEPTPNQTPNLSEALSLSLSPTLPLSQNSFSSSNVPFEENPKKPKKPKVEDTPEAKAGRLKIKQAFISAQRLRWGTEPKTDNAAFNTQVKNLQKKFGTEDACRLVEFYVNHPKAFYVENTHSFWICLKDADTLYTQMNRGKAITKTMVRTYEKAVQNNEYQEQISNMFTEEKDVNGH